MHERAVDLPNDAADIELNLPDLAQIRRAIVFDTSVLLSDEGEKFFELMKGLEDAQYLRDILFLMPYTVLEELDHLKGRTEENIARRSRIASGYVHFKIFSKSVSLPFPLLFLSAVF